MKIKLLTYNLLFNRAYGKLRDIVLAEKPDLLALQEIETSSENLKTIEELGFALADFSNSFFKHRKIYGVATFYNPKTIKAYESQSINLPRSVYEILLFFLRAGNKPRTVLQTELSLKSNNKRFIVYNLHLSPLGTNGLRMKQIEETFDMLHINKKPSVIVGDFNFPFGKKRFEALIEKYGLKEATNNIDFTFEKKLLMIVSLKFKLDYVLYHNLKQIQTNRLNYRFSDHYPILSTFEF